VSKLKAMCWWKNGNSFFRFSNGNI